MHKKHLVFVMRLKQEDRIYNTTKIERKYVNRLLISHKRKCHTIKYNIACYQFSRKQSFNFLNEMIVNNDL